MVSLSCIRLNGLGISKQSDGEIVMQRFLHLFLLGNDPLLDISLGDCRPFSYPPLIVRQRNGKKPPKRTDRIPAPDVSSVSKLSGYP